MLGLRLIHGLLSLLFEPAGLGLKAIALAMFAGIHPGLQLSLFS
jgi:hypothetical protein